MRISASTIPITAFLTSKLSKSYNNSAKINKYEKNKLSTIKVQNDYGPYPRIPGNRTHIHLINFCHELRSSLMSLK